MFHHELYPEIIETFHREKRFRQSLETSSTIASFCEASRVLSFASWLKMSGAEKMDYRVRLAVRAGRGTSPF
jgi:hypothetical protein